ncbi:MAG: hypothetical protein AB7F98_09240 [Novosphingobium sp.]
MLPALAITAGVAALVAPTLSAGPVRSASPLLPLSERDLSATKQMGCECSFNRGRATLVQMIGNEFTVRTRAGRQVCRISDRQFSSFSVGTPVTCAAMNFTLRHTGRTVSHIESDSAVTPSALTIRRGRTRTVLNGSWGCAC